MTAFLWVIKCTIQHSFIMPKILAAGKMLFVVFLFIKFAKIWAID